MGQRVLMISLHGDPLATPGGPQSGGQNVYVRSLAGGLCESGHEVDVITHRYDPRLASLEIAPEGFRVLRIDGGRLEPISTTSFFPFLPAMLEEALARAKAERPYDVLHTHYWLSGWVGQRLSERLGLPWVHTFHSLGHVKRRVGGEAVASERLLAEERIALEAGAVIATSPVEAAEIRQMTDALARVEVVLPGIDLEHFAPGDPAEAMARLGVQGERPILFVGRPVPAKGLMTLVAAHRQLRAPRPPVWVVGSGHEAARPGWVHWGARPHRELPDFFRSALLLAVPSHYESFGLVAAEAAVCGCPVVASDVGGLRTSVCDRVSGVLVPPRDVNAWAQAMQRLVDDDEVRSRYAVQGARWARQVFDWRVLVERVLGVYASVTRGAVRRAASGV